MATAVHHGKAVGWLPVARTIEQAVEQLKRDPNTPVRTQVGDLTVELRAVSAGASGRSAEDAFAEVGPWEGETTEEALAMLAEARRGGGQRSVPEL